MYLWHQYKGLWLYFILKGSFNYIKKKHTYYGVPYSNAAGAFHITHFIRNETLSGFEQARWIENIFLLTWPYVKMKIAVRCVKKLKKAFLAYVMWTGKRVLKRHFIYLYKCLFKIKILLYYLFPTLPNFHNTDKLKVLFYHLVKIKITIYRDVP